jgi:hypothetical protein
MPADLLQSVEATAPCDQCAESAASDRGCTELLYEPQSPLLPKNDEISRWSYLHTTEIASVKGKESVCLYLLRPQNVKQVVDSTTDHIRSLGAV